MDSFEFTKIAGPVLAALLLIVSFRTYNSTHQPHYDPAAGYTLPAPAPEEGAKPAEGKEAAGQPAESAKPAEGQPADAKTADANAPDAKPAEAPPADGKAADAKSAEAAPAFNPADIVAKIASAKPDAGKKAFARCLQCHTADAAAASKAGPNLWNVVNRKLGARDDFKGYSEQLKAKGGEWTYEHLAGFLHNPKGYIPGTKMAFAGVTKPQELADLLAYIRTLADSPVPPPN